MQWGISKCAICVFWEVSLGVDVMMWWLELPLPSWTHAHKSHISERAEREQEQPGSLVKTCHQPWTAYIFCVREGYMPVFKNLTQGYVYWSERERETSTPTGDLTHNPVMCLDWGSNLKLFGVRDDAPTNSATQPGPCTFFKATIWGVFLLLESELKPYR